MIQSESNKCSTEYYFTSKSVLVSQGLGDSAMKPGVKVTVCSH